MEMFMKSQLLEIINYFNDHIDQEHGLIYVNDQFKEDHNISDDDYIYDVVMNDESLMTAYYNAIVDEINNYQIQVDQDNVKVFSKF
jgi:hypothetical protein